MFKNLNYNFSKKRVHPAPLLDVRSFVKSKDRVIPTSFLYGKKSMSKSGAGFTILEVIIAIFLITVGLISVYSTATYITSSSRLSKGKLIASQLAQEGVEVVRNIRDQNWMEQRGWLDSLGNGTYVPVFYTDADDPNDISITPALTWNLSSIGDSGDPRNAVYTKYDDQDKFLFYFQSSNQSNLPTNYRRTVFKRWIILNCIDCFTPTEAKLEITSRVEWKENGITQNFEITDYLYDWQVPLSSCPSGFAIRNGSSSSISYYSGGPGDPENADACAGQEMVLSDGAAPYRADDTQTCVGIVSSSLTYRSMRTSGAICEPAFGSGSYYIVTNPK